MESTSFRTQGHAGSGNLTKARKTKRVQDGLKLLMAMPRKLSATKRMRMTHHEKRVRFAEPAAVVAFLEKSAQLPLKVAAEASKQEAAAAAAQRTKDKKYHITSDIVQFGVYTGGGLKAWADARQWEPPMGASKLQPSMGGSSHGAHPMDLGWDSSSHRHQALSVTIEINRFHISVRRALLTVDRALRTLPDATPR